jgi:hypothetical protein
MVQKWNQKLIHPYVIDSPSVPCNTQVKVTMLARLLLTRCTKAVHVWTWCIHEQNMCSFSIFTLHQNHLLLFMKHLAERTLTRKYWIRQQYINVPMEIILYICLTKLVKLFQNINDDRVWKISIFFNYLNGNTVKVRLSGTLGEWECADRSILPLERMVTYNMQF